MQVDVHVDAAATATAAAATPLRCPRATMDVHVDDGVVCTPWAGLRRLASNMHTHAIVCCACLRGATGGGSGYAGVCRRWHPRLQCKLLLQQPHVRRRGIAKGSRRGALLVLAVVAAAVTGMDGTRRRQWSALARGDGSSGCCSCTRRRRRRPRLMVMVRDSWARWQLHVTIRGAKQ